MYLVIAEKPSVSRAIAEVIGAQEREDGYLQGTDCMVSWCFGHLAEYVSPDAYDEKFNQWRYEDLPIIPKDWKVTVSEDKKDQFYILKRLLNSPEIEYVVNACDAGRAYTGLMVRKEGEMLTPTINLNQLYEAYKAQPGVTMETVCRKIADIVIEAPIQVDLKAILNYEDVKDKLFIRVSSAEANKEVLEIVPHQLKEDLAITYHVAVGKNQDGLSSMLITNEMMKEYGVTQEQIHEDAMKSSPRVMVPEVSSIGVLIDEIYQKNILMLTPDEREMLLETLQESSEMPTFFVVTNTERIDGAGVIFYPEFMDNMGELLGNDFFILPSSIHQMLILPDDGQVDAEMLRDMVKEVNATQVAPAERLTNDVYHFDTKDHVFEKADRFTERQKEKEAQVAKTEKVGKEQPDQKPKTKKHDMEL